MELLGQMLQEQARNWFIHTIRANSDQQVSLADVLIALKQYFIKNTSLRDSALKFDKISQGGRSVNELLRELEHLSLLMIQAPSDYDFKHRFVNALNSKIAAEVTRFGVNPENNSMEELLEVAQRVQESAFFLQ